MPDMSVRVGVAGWDYRDWSGVLYPSPRPRGFDPVRYLAQYIDLIEINSTFYRPARGEVAERWAERVADFPGFRYSAKLWRRFTHERESGWTRADVAAVVEGFQPLADAGVLDAMLIQFPWSFRNVAENRDWLSDVVDAFAAFPLVIEVRHESWNIAEFYDWLGEHGAGFVNIDQPLFSKSIKPSARTTACTGYVRVHGRNYREWFRKNAGRDARYDYLYTDAELRPWVRRTEEIAQDRGVDKVDVVFNNHYRAQAVVNAIQFRHLLSNEAEPAPPLLFERYPDALENAAYPVDAEIEAMQS